MMMAKTASLNAMARLVSDRVPMLSSAAPGRWLPTDARDKRASQSNHQRES